MNGDIREHCGELAEQGFVAVAPDLYWRQEPGVDLSVNSDTDWQHAVRLYQAYDRDAGARDVKDAVGVVAELPDCTGKVALLGYCFGGLMAFLTAARYGVDAGVAFHGGETEKYLDEVGGLDVPFLMHLAEEDEFISKAAQADICSDAQLRRQCLQWVDSKPSDWPSLPTHHLRYERSTSVREPSRSSISR